MSLTHNFIFEIGIQKGSNRTIMLSDMIVTLKKKKKKFSHYGAQVC